MEDFALEQFKFDEVEFKNVSDYYSTKNKLKCEFSLSEKFAQKNKSGFVGVFVVGFTSSRQFLDLTDINIQNLNGLNGEAQFEGN